MREAQSWVECAAVTVPSGVSEVPDAEDDLQRELILCALPRRRSPPFLTLYYQLTPFRPARPDFTRTCSYQAAHAAVQQGIAQFEDAGEPFHRPPDYFAEMIKSDEHMEKVRARVRRKAPVHVGATVPHLPAPPRAGQVQAASGAAQDGGGRPAPGRAAQQEVCQEGAGRSPPLPSSLPHSSPVGARLVSTSAMVLPPPRPPRSRSKTRSCRRRRSASARR